jgi:plastocyanin
MRLAGAAVLAALALAAPATAKTVVVGDNVFLPGDLTVKQGTTVTWAWEGSRLHNISVADGPKQFRSRPQRDGRFTRTMRRPGTYQLVCTIHTPEMQMTLRVRRKAS